MVMSESKKTIRVLYLEHSPVFLERLRDFDFNFELIHISPENQFCRSINDPVYLSPNQQQSETIIDLTKNQRIDLIVVGNNCEVGLAWAELIAQEMRSKTIIVWNNYRRGNEILYSRIGFAHFCSRVDLVQKSSQVLGVEIIS
jgi:hypothetical protein